VGEVLGRLRLASTEGICMTEEEIPDACDSTSDGWCNNFCRARSSAKYATVEGADVGRGEESREDGLTMECEELGR
jgi:hypothetical protein